MNAGRCAVLAAAAVLAGLLGTSPAVTSDADGVVELVLPRPVSSDETVHVEVKTGALPPGAEISVTIADGSLAGTVSPFGFRANGRGAVYAIPVPKSAVVNSHLMLRLRVEQPGAAPRPPRPGEVESITPKYVPITR